MKTINEIIQDLEILILHNEDDLDRGQGKYIIQQYIDYLKKLKVLDKHEKIVISLDFDVTLLGSKDNKALNFYNKYKDKFEFIILTRRYDDYHSHLWKDNFSNKDLYKYLEENNLDKSKVFFQNFDYKYKFLKESIVVVHIDDDSYELDLINTNTNTYAISCFHENLEEAILKYISEGIIL